ncbi:hypothetical protein NHF40_04205 [Maricaulaceae bacterium EIL42A08]|nr:hypothetical protein [Maricaulaceae bacterium EIL42A08]
MKRILLTTVAATTVMLCGCVVVVDDRGHSNDGDKSFSSRVMAHHQLDTDGAARLMEADISASDRADNEAQVTKDDLGAGELAPGETCVAAADIQITPRNGERCDRGWEG